MSISRGQLQKEPCAENVLEEFIFGIFTVRRICPSNIQIETLFDVNEKIGCDAHLSGTTDKGRSPKMTMTTVQDMA